MRRKICRSMCQCGRKPRDHCGKEFIQKSKVKLRSGTTKRKKTSILDIKEKLKLRKS